MNKFYITTAIDYVNDTIHIGHAFQKIAADVLARYFRIKSGADNVFFLTGTDEYGQKAEKAAREKGLNPESFVKKISDSDQKEQDALNISYNRFIRTTDEDHKKVVEEIWKKVYDKGDIYLAEYQGLYCEGCEAYCKKEELENGKCPFHPNLEIKELKEKNYFFKWEKYKDFLVGNIKKNENFIWPEERAKEMLKFAENIKDIPVSRSNFKWGIKVPGDETQVIYVWFDALLNYISGIGYLETHEQFKKFWPADVHVLGKDNLRWHSLLWPAILKSAGIPLPKTILVNGFLNINGEKISKSTGNIIRPSEWAEKFGADAVRYYLLRYTVFTEDSDVSEEKLKQAYNSDLANGLGNLVARVAKLSEKAGIEFKNPEELKFSKRVETEIEKYNFNQALRVIWEEISEIDKSINQDEPWRINDKNKLEEKLNCYIRGIINIAYQLEPFLPETAEKIQKIFFSQRISVSSLLFPRIN